jgi:hypothetical protein
MIIANPIYDVVFKRLMEDDRIAKFFMATLLNENIESVQVKPQEFTYTDQLAGLAVFRVDFIATIKTLSGDYKKVLIEIQKAKNPIDLMRFRNYLAEQYKKEDDIETPTGKKKIPLPIVTIYLLGFVLTEIETSTVRVKRQYLDLISNQVIDKKSEFIEKLTHDCFVVQLPRIETKQQTRLDKLLSIFEQTNFVDDKKIIKQYNHQIDEEGVKEMAEVLHYIGTDPTEKKQIEDEQEAYRVLDLAVREKTEELKEELLKSKKALEDKDKALEDKDKALEKMAKQLEELKRKFDKK